MATTIGGAGRLTGDHDVAARAGMSACVTVADSLG
jgi:hypothetical protein